jgi:hypothetical protein
MTRTQFCPFAKSDMTPCVRRDGHICWVLNTWDKPICVGCERGPQTVGITVDEEALVEHLKRLEGRR